MCVCVCVHQKVSLHDATEVQSHNYPSLSTGGPPSLLEGLTAAPVWDSLTGSANSVLFAPPAEEEVVLGISFGFFGGGAPLLVVPAPPPPEDFDPTHTHTHTHTHNHHR